MSGLHVSLCQPIESNAAQGLKPSCELAIRKKCCDHCDKVSLLPKLSIKYVRYMYELVKSEKWMSQITQNCFMSTEQDEKTTIRSVQRIIVSEAI